MSARLSLLLAQAGGSGDRLLMPKAASTEAARVDALFYFLVYISIFFFLLVVGVMVLFAVKYRRRREGQRTSPIEGHRKLEIAWAVIPAILLVVIFAWGFRDFVNLSVPPGDALEVRVTGQKWSWSFDYPREGINTNELVVPEGQPVKLILSSQDVIHSFYVPAFRIKRDVVPNRYTVTWFQATERGEYDVLCAEYCGTGHSSMLAKIKVVSDTDYQKWVDSGGGLSGKGMSSADFGKLLFKSKGCTACHSVDGSKLTGPSLLNKYGTKTVLSDGSQVLIDDNYLRESITQPNAKVVQGFQPVMPTFAGRLKEKQLNALIDYIKSLSKAGEKAATKADKKAGDKAEPKAGDKAEEKAEPKAGDKAEEKAEPKAAPKAGPKAEEKPAGD
jgi:cytochrome c oxidase subunit 2